MKINIEQTNYIINNNGASIDFLTGKLTTKQGFLISIKDTESQIKNINTLTPEELTDKINNILSKNTYNKDLNIKNILGFWVKDNTLYIDVSKCIKATKTDFFKVKNEALINNQYEVYNNITNKRYKLILPIYTLYNTDELLNTINVDNFNTNTYSKDFYTREQIKKYYNFITNGDLTHIVFNSVDDIPTNYNYSKVIIKDLTNYTRDVLDYDVNLSIDVAFKYSRLIEVIDED